MQRKVDRNLSKTRNERGEGGIFILKGKQIGKEEKERKEMHGNLPTNSKERKKRLEKDRENKEGNKHSWAMGEKQGQRGREQKRNCVDLDAESTERKEGGKTLGQGEKRGERQKRRKEKGRHKERRES